MYKWFPEHFWELNQKLINLPFFIRGNYVKWGQVISSTPGIVAALHLRQALLQHFIYGFSFGFY